MTVALIVVVVVLAGALAGLVTHDMNARRPRPGRAPSPEPGSRRILFPYQAAALSRPALDAALRLARAEGATLVPVFLARVPMTLPLDSPLPRQAATCIPLQEAIEQRAAAFGVPVDARLGRGRTYQHALAETIAHETFDRIVIAAADDSRAGFGPADVAWLLAHARGEIVVLRPGEEDRLAPAPPRPERRLRGSNGGVPRAVSERRRPVVRS